MYTTDILDKRVKIINVVSSVSEFGKGKQTWTEQGTFWASVDFTRGAKAMREGELQAYDVVMVRMRYNTVVERNSRLKIGTKFYAIQSFNSDFHLDQIQITAQEIEKFTYTSAKEQTTAYDNTADQ